MLNHAWLRELRQLLASCKALMLSMMLCVNPIWGTWTEEFCFSSPALVSFERAGASCNFVLIGWGTCIRSWAARPVAKRCGLLNFMRAPAYSCSIYDYNSIFYLWKCPSIISRASVAFRETSWTRWIFSHVIFGGGTIWKRLVWSCDLWNRTVSISKLKPMCICFTYLYPFLAMWICIRLLDWDNVKKAKPRLRWAIYELRLLWCSPQQAFVRIEF